MTTRYDEEVVVMAAVLTVFLFLGLTSYAFHTEEDFTQKQGLIWNCIFILIGAFFVGLIYRSHFIQLLVSIVCLVIAGIFLIYDTQLIIGKHSHKFSIDDYIMAAMNIYLDIMMIFIYLLQILGGGGNE